MLGGGGNLGMRANTHRDGTVGVGREHSAPEVTFPRGLSNTHLSILKVLDPELPKKVDKKAGFPRGEGI